MENLLLLLLRTSFIIQYIEIVLVIQNNFIVAQNLSLIQRNKNGDFMINFNDCQENGGKFENGICRCGNAGTFYSVPDLGDYCYPGHGALLGCKLYGVGNSKSVEFIEKEQKLIKVANEFDCKFEDAKFTITNYEYWNHIEGFIKLKPAFRILIKKIKINHNDNKEKTGFHMFVNRNMSAVQGMVLKISINICDQPQCILLKINGTEKWQPFKPTPSSASSLSPTISKPNNASDTENLSASRTPLLTSTYSISSTMNSDVGVIKSSDRGYAKSSVSTTILKSDVTTSSTAKSTVILPAPNFNMKQQDDKNVTVKVVLPIVLLVIILLLLLFFFIWLWSKRRTLKYKQSDNMHGQPPVPLDSNQGIQKGKFKGGVVIENPNYVTLPNRKAENEYVCILPDKREQNFIISSESENKYEYIDPKRLK